MSTIGEIMFAPPIRYRKHAQESTMASKASRDERIARAVFSLYCSKLSMTEFKNGHLSLSLGE